MNQQQTALEMKRDVLKISEEIGELIKASYPTGPPGGDLLTFTAGLFDYTVRLMAMSQNLTKSEAERFKLIMLNQFAQAVRNASEGGYSRELLLREFNVLRKAVVRVVTLDFPVGCQVRYRGDVATVDSHHQRDADTLPLRFENGNVWDKPVNELERIK